MKHFFLVIGFIASGILSNGQTARIVGYLPTHRFPQSSQIEYCKLTHLNLSFANPDNAGNIIMPSISSVVSDALRENPNIIICVSFAGGVITSQQSNDWSNLIDVPANRPAFISKIVAFVLANKVHGVDIDLEWDNVTKGYSDFIIELDAALTPHNKILTVAFPNQTLFSNITPAALGVIDFINIMSYDYTGPWNPSNPGQHSTYSVSESGINFWKNTTGVSGSKLNLGVPFYGYEFINSSTVNTFTYASMVDKNTAYADLDNVGAAYYNGRPTIEAKVELAKNEVGGIMIWELGQDSFDDYSLLTTIQNKYASLGITTTNLCGSVTSSLIESLEQYKIYPNPASDFFILEHTNELHPKVTIADSIGQPMSIKAIHNGEKELKVDVSQLKSGLYFVTIADRTRLVKVYKLIVIK